MKDEMITHNDTVEEVAVDAIHEEVVEERIPFLSRKNLYSKIKVSVGTMNIIIYVLIALLLICLALGIFVFQ